MFTRPQPGRALTTDDLIEFIDELERELSSMSFGDGFIVESGGNGAKISVDLGGLAQWLKLRGTN